MNKTLKRTLAIALTLVMLTAMVPMMASAVDLDADDFIDEELRFSGVVNPPRAELGLGTATLPVITSAPNVFNAVRNGGWNAEGGSLTGTGFAGVGGVVNVRFTLTPTGTKNFATVASVTALAANADLSGIFDTPANIAQAIFNNFMRNSSWAPVHYVAIGVVNDDLQVTVGYKIQGQVVNSINVASQLVGTPVVGASINTVTDPVVTKTADVIDDIEYLWLDGAQFGNSGDTQLQITIKPVAKFTFVGATFLHATGGGTDGFANDAAKDAMKAQFTRSTDISAALSDRSLVLTITYPLLADGAGSNSDLRARLIAPGATIIPITNNINLSGDPIALGGSKTLSLNGYTVKVGTSGAFTNVQSLTIEGNGTLEIPATLIGTISEFVVKDGAILRVTAPSGDITIPKPVILDGGTLDRQRNTIVDNVTVAWAKTSNITGSGNLVIPVGKTLTMVDPDWRSPSFLNVTGNISLSGKIALIEGKTTLSTTGNLTLAASSALIENEGTINIAGTLSRTLSGSKIENDGTIKAGNFGLAGTGDDEVANNGTIVVTGTFTYDLAAQDVLDNGGLFLAGNAFGSAEFRTLRFNGNTVPGTILMLNTGDNNNFDIRKMGKGAAFFSSEGMEITGWYRYANFTGDNFITTASFPGSFGPLFARWSNIPVAPIPVPKTPEELVKGFFEYMLGRGADEDGLEYWTEEIKSGRLPGRQLGVAFVTSPEFTSRNLSDADFVEALYKGILGRISEPLGKAYWVGQLATQSRAAVARNFANAGEFKALLEKLEIAW